MHKLTNMKTCIDIKKHQQELIHAENCIVQIQPYCKVLLGLLYGNQSKCSLQVKNNLKHLGFILFILTHHEHSHLW